MDDEDILLLFRLRGRAVCRDLPRQRRGHAVVCGSLFNDEVIYYYVVYSCDTHDASLPSVNGSREDDFISTSTSAIIQNPVRDALIKVMA
ncbi:hypothetical protein OUZ56_005567 [Daphnia magna]|uniref:Uncharacterized protein n=1 Tax=Daphnia magna TaxID=35525 RepID=A0ABQ9YT60_9CRUS|nr:hypothetical protein OUZ56_005567 [Daphnia magna]